MESVNSKVSVIIALYNYDKYIREAVESVKEQTHKDWEIIIVDDCSTDNSFSEAQKLQSEIGDRLKLIKNTTNRGVSYSRNLAMSKSTGEFIAFLDADDLWQPTKLERQLKVFDELGKNVDIVHTGAKIFSDSNTVDYLKNNSRPINSLDHWDIAFNRNFPMLFKRFGGNYSKIFCSSNPTLFSSYMIRKKVLSTVSEFDEGLLYQVEDWLFMFKCSLFFKFYFIPDKLTCYRVHRQGYTMRVFNQDNFFSSIARDQIRDRCWEFAKQNDRNLQYKDIYPKKNILRNLIGNKSFNIKRFLGKVYRHKLKKLKTKSDGGLRQLVLFVTSACGLSCKGCFYADQLNAKDDLSLEDIKAIACSADNMESVLLTGGEAFLRSDIREVIELFIKKCNVNIVTNGFLPKKIMNDIISVLASNPSHHLHISVSVDGFKEAHNKRRGDPNSYSRAIDTLHILCNLKNQYKQLSVSVNTVISPDNINELAAFAKEFSVKFDLNYHNFEIERSNSYSTEYFMTHSDEFLQSYKRLLKIIYKYYPFSYDVSRSRFAVQYENIVNKQDWKFPCLAGKKIIVVYPSGELAACEMRSAVTNLSNFDYNLNLAMKSQLMEKEISQIKTDKCFCTHGCWLLVSMFESPITLKGYSKLEFSESFKRLTFLRRMDLIRRRIIYRFF
jgi:glycosyltransferase involved in cell wall biosynthesis/MoaA/NifB/PqqE/SkfB family radical SAM enzyme